MNEKKEMVPLCGLWLKQDKNGNDYFVGSIGGASVMIFKNNRKESQSHPDYNVFLSKKEFKKKEISHEAETASDDIPF